MVAWKLKLKPRPVVEEGRPARGCSGASHCGDHTVMSRVCSPSSPDSPPGPQGFQMGSACLPLPGSILPLRSALPRLPGAHLSPWHSTQVIVKNLNQSKSLPSLTPSRHVPSHLGTKAKVFTMSWKACTIWLLATSWVPSQATLPVTHHHAATSAFFFRSGHQAAPYLGTSAVLVPAAWNTLLPTFLA